MYEAQLSGEALIDGVAELLSPWVPACATTPRVLYFRRGPGLRVSCRALICVSRVAACSVVCAGVCVYCTRSVESLIDRSTDRRIRTVTAGIVDIELTAVRVYY